MRIAVGACIGVEGGAVAGEAGIAGQVPVEVGEAAVLGGGPAGSAEAH